VLTPESGSQMGKGETVETVETVNSYNIMVHAKLDEGEKTGSKETGVGRQYTEGLDRLNRLNRRRMKDGRNFDGGNGGFGGRGVPV